MKKAKFSNLFKKLKKTNPLLKYIYLFILVIYFISIVAVTYAASLLDGIETIIRVFTLITMYLYFFIFLVVGLALLIAKKHKSLIIFTIFTSLFSIINFFGFYYIDKTYNIVDEISKDKIIYTTSFVKLKDHNEDIKTIGIISKEDDIEGYILPQEYLIEHNSKYKINNYDNNIELLNALYSKEVDAIFITSNYVIKYSENEEFSDLNDVTTIIDSYSKKMNNQDSNIISTDKNITEPFTVLLLGVDSEYDGLANNAAFNGDSIMLITFNPKTLSATVFSIPRDTYVPIACNNNKSYKINSAAGYGTKCMIDTIQNLTDVTIDYYVKINFKGVVALVNALGGITVNVDVPDYKKNLKVDCKGMVCEQNSNRQFGADLVYIEPGENRKLNGEQALAYARNRHQWISSDFKRIEHQQAVVTAIANKAKTIRSIDTFYKVLNAIANNIDTNMSTKQMLNFYNVGKNILLNNNFDDNEFINIQKTYLTGYDLTMYLYGHSVYTFQYYEESLDEIKQAMKENLEIEKPELIKSFDFSVNKPFEVPVIGKKYSSVRKNETLPDFKGSTIQYLESWLSSRNIPLTKNYTESNTCINNSILNQSVHSGTLVSTITNLTVDICKNVTESTTPPEETKPTTPETKEEQTIDEPIENMVN